MNKIIMLIVFILFLHGVISQKIRNLVMNKQLVIGLNRRPQRFALNVYVLRALEENGHVS